MRSPFQTIHLWRSLPRSASRRSLRSLGKNSSAPSKSGLRTEFPVLRQERETGLLITPDGVATQQASTSIWRMSDADGRWTISVAPGFIALQTADYSRRADFFARLRTALMAFEEEVHPGYFDRLGVRYVNRFVGDKRCSRNYLVQCVESHSGWPSWPTPAAWRACLNTLRLPSSPLKVARCS